MKKFLIATIAFLFISLPIFLFASQNMPKEQDPFRNSQFGEICRKVMIFLNDHPSKHNLELPELVNEKVITNIEYKFLIENKIKYNPPSSAAKDDNFLSIFDIDYENGTSGHILYTIVDISNPKITKLSTLASFPNYLTQWYNYKSNRKHLSVTKKKKKYYLSLSYYDNEHWDKQHLLGIMLETSHNKEIERLLAVIDSSNMPYRTYEAQKHTNIDVRLPSNLEQIELLCNKILTDFYFLKTNESIEYVADGFRFK